MDRAQDSAHGRLAMANASATIKTLTVPELVRSVVRASLMALSSRRHQLTIEVLGGVSQHRHDDDQAEEQGYSYRQAYTDRLPVACVQWARRAKLFDEIGGGVSLERTRLRN
jgi:hypothetical protein